MTFSRLRTSAFAALLAVVSACNDRPAPMQPEVADLRRSLSTAAIPAFTFLEPLNRSGDPRGTLNTSLPLVVDVCPAAGDCSDASRIIRFTSDGTGARTVRVAEDGSGWIVNWRTSDTPAAVAGTYRIEIRVGEVLLGAREVRILAAGSSLNGGSPTHSIVQGQTLPIRFWIPNELIQAELISEAGGEIESADSGLVLAFPAGALTQNTVVTVEPLTEIPQPDGVLPGTAFEFGPDGTTFEEPVFIGIQVDPATIPAGVSPSQLRVHRLEGGHWIPLPFADFDPQTNTVGTWTEHFSTYAVLPEAFTRVAPGDSHACAAAFSAVYCWGSNTFGQLGNGRAPLGSTVAVPVSLPRFLVGTWERCRRTGGVFNRGWSCVTEPIFQTLQVEQIDASSAHTCIIGRHPLGGERLPYCWGLNLFGQLGDGTTTNATVPVRFGDGARSYTRIAAGTGTSCGLDSAGDVFCVGRTTQGAIGNGSIAECAPDAFCVQLRRVELPGPAVDVRSGLQSSCAQLQSGATYCWGWNNVGQLGDGTLVNPRPPVQVLGGPYASISPGSGHSCALSSIGEVTCWGNGATGALGRGTTANAQPPLSPIPGLRLAQIQAGKGNAAARHTCGVDEIGVAYCWGSNNSGQLGVMTAPQTCLLGSCATSPSPVATSFRFREIRLGLEFTCAVLVDGGVACWGRNTNGELGDGTTVSRSIPTRVVTSTQ